MAIEILETERLRLRPYSLADEAALFRVFAAPYARRFYPEMRDPSRVRAWIEWNLRNYDECGFGVWAVELEAEGRFIGDCGLTYQDVEGRMELEIGYHVLESERGKGYATEAARGCLDLGFTRTSRDLVGAIVRPSNQTSCAVAGRIHSARRDFVRKGEAAVSTRRSPGRSRSSRPVRGMPRCPGKLQWCAPTEDQ